MELWLRICFFILCGISVVMSFSWSNCGSSTDPVKVISLDAYSNQTKILYISGRGKLAVNLTPPIKAEVEVQKKFFWNWIRIPCIDNVGSCTFEDACQLSPYEDDATCPPGFTKNQLPCRCPLLQGQYTVKKFPINLGILPNWIEEGKYRIKIKLRKGYTQIMCLLMLINF